MVQFWEKWSTSKDANNMLHMLWTWQHGDSGAQSLYAEDSGLTDVWGRFGDRGNGKAGAGGKADEAAFERACKGFGARY